MNSSFQRGYEFARTDPVFRAASKRFLFVQFLVAAVLLAGFWQHNRYALVVLLVYPAAFFAWAAGVSFGQEFASWAADGDSWRSGVPVADHRAILIEHGSLLVGYCATLQRASLLGTVVDLARSQAERGVNTRSRDAALNGAAKAVEMVATTSDEAAQLGYCAAGVVYAVFDAAELNAQRAEAA